MNKFTVTAENLEVCGTLVDLAKENLSDAIVLRRLCTQAGICSEYVLATSPSSPSVYYYFLNKGTKRTLKLQPEVDVTVLGKKLEEADLQKGVDFFVEAADYVLFINEVIVPALAKPSEPEVPDKDNGELRDEQIEDAGEEGGACSKDVIPPVEDGKEDGSTNPDPAGGTKEPELKKSKTCRIPKVIATPVRPEDRRFCIFHEFIPIPKMVSNLPGQFNFSQEEMVALSSRCGGSALYGVVNSEHPLYSQPLVCAKHSTRKYYHIYGPDKCPEVYSSTKVPNLAQIRVQGTGSRPPKEAGSVQSNKDAMRCSREKQIKAKDQLLKSYSDLLQEKDELSILVQSQQESVMKLQEEKDYYARQFYFCNQELGNTKKELASVQEHMQTLSSVCEQNVASVRNLEIELQTLVYPRNQQDLL